MVTTVEVERSRMFIRVYGVSNWDLIFVNGETKISVLIILTLTHFMIFTIWELSLFIHRSSFVLQFLQEANITFCICLILWHKKLKNF